MSSHSAVPERVRAVVSNNLKIARNMRGISLSGLAEISGIGKATLSGIERGEGNPTIETLWNLANSLNVPFGQLISSESEDTTVYNSDGVSARLINRQSSPRVIETFVMELAANTKRVAEPHCLGVVEQAVMLKGKMVIGSNEESALIGPGQVFKFSSDVPHIYQSLDEVCSVLITVIYPADDEKNADSRDKQRNWPVLEDDWSGLNAQVNRIALESRQGIVATRLIFENCPLGDKAALATLRTRVSEAQRSVSGSQLYLVHEVSPMIISLSRQGHHGLIDDADLLSAEVLKQAITICNLAFSPWLSIDAAQRNRLGEIAQSDSVCLATLAAEALTRHGHPCVPSQAAPKFEKTIRATSQSDSASFEDRINVDAYAAYELVHPAYAKQTVAIANKLHTYLGDSPATILDVGTGPGLPLKMLLELNPHVQVTAVDPSEVAFHHLKKLFNNCSNVTPIQISITDLPAPQQPYRAAISVGASHHLDTLSFLTSTRAQLTSGGLFIVADEMISKFSNSIERNRQLLVHHLQYVADTLIVIPEQELVHDEGVLVRLINLHVPLALFEAEVGKHVDAEGRTRKLLEELRKLNLPVVPSDPLLAFYRLHFLELEALVAGLDYEVEQKTYPQCFMDLAAHAGFSVLSHQRLYATSGRSEWDAGTHLFVLKAL